MNKWLLKCLVFSVVVSASAGTAAMGDVAAGTTWSQPYFTRLDVSFPGNEYHARWDFHRCDCGDVLVRNEETLPEDVISGELLLVGGRVLLTRGFDAAQDKGPAMLDSPMLMLQLLFVLLQKAVPSGPAAVDAPLDIAVFEENQALELDTGQAFGGFPAPWGLRGAAQRTARGSLRFELAFDFEARLEGRAVGRSAIHLSGELAYQPAEFPYADETDLRDWAVHFIRDGDAELFSGDPAATLAELRQQLVVRAKSSEQ